MKNTVYVVDDWFDYQNGGLEHDADAFPIAVCVDLEKAKEKATTRAKEALGEFINEGFDKNGLSIEKINQTTRDNIVYALGVYSEAQGLLEQIKVFKMILNK